MGSLPTVLLERINKAIIFKVSLFIFSTEVFGYIISGVRIQL
jgi:hypothetical protein